MTGATGSKRSDICVLVLGGDAERYATALASAFPAMHFATCTSYDALPDILRDRAPEVALTFKIGTDPFPSQALIDSGCVKWIHAGGAGIDHLRPWPDAVTVTNSSGIHGDIMAEYVVASIIAFNHNGRIYEMQQARRHWHKYDSRTIAGQTLTIVGYGSIGGHVARLARAVGMRVIGVRSRPEAEQGGGADELQIVGRDRLHWALGRGDHLAICLPLTEATRGLIGAEALGAAKPGVHLINVARGGIVDETALLAALESGHIAGATLDVFAKEPLPPDSPFWAMENVRITPHSSSDIEGWQQRVIDLFRANLECWCDGAPLRNVVQSERGY